MHVCTIFHFDSLVLRLDKTPELILEIVLGNEHAPDAVDHRVASIAILG
jgi:hypothetical protein